MRRSRCHANRSSESGSASESSRKRERDNENFKEPLPRSEIDTDRSMKKAMSKLM